MVQSRNRFSLASKSKAINPTPQDDKTQKKQQSPLQERNKTDASRDEGETPIVIDLDFLFLQLHAAWRKEIVVCGSSSFLEYKLKTFQLKF